MFGLAWQEGDGSYVQLPALSLFYTMPSDGLPHMSYWQNNASDIYNIGFEAHREALEVTPRQNAPKDAMAKYIVTKGLGRVSIVMLGLAWTFLNIAQNMTEEVEKDFIRQGGRAALASIRQTAGIRGWFHQERPKSLMGMEVVLGTSKVLLSLKFGVGTLHRFASLESGSCNLWTIAISFRSSVCSKTVSVVSLGCPER